MHWTVKALLFAALAYCLPIVYRFLAKSGLCVPRIDHAPGPCRVVPGIECGSEDIEGTSDGLAFISSGFRGLKMCKEKHPGAIYLFDFGDPDANVTKMTIESKTINMELFEPHGMGLREDKSTGEVRLFVIDHSEARDVVRIFVYKRDDKYTLHHIDDVYDSTFSCMNDVVPTGKRSFYVSNYLHLCHMTKHALHLEAPFYSFFGLTNVAYYDGQAGRFVIKGLKMANGIELSLKGDYLFVLTIDQHLNVYKRGKATNSLSSVPVARIPVKGYGDNVNVDANGDLYIGGHTHMWMPLYNAPDGPNATPVQVTRVHPLTANWSSYEVTEVLHNSGVNFVRMGSSAYHYQKQLLIGTVAHRLGYCRMETMY